jgi:hypothetical protein
VIFGYGAGEAVRVTTELEMSHTSPRVVSTDTVQAYEQCKLEAKRGYPFRAYE